MREWLHKSGKARGLASPRDSQLVQREGNSPAWCTALATPALATFVLAAISHSLSALLQPKGHTLLCAFEFPVSALLSPSHACPAVRQSIYQPFTSSPTPGFDVASGQSGSAFWTRDVDGKYRGAPGQAGNDGPYSVYDGPLLVLP